MSDTEKSGTKAGCALGWHDGSCCCNCHNQLELRKHPSNSTFGKGNISEGCGWVCMLPASGGFGPHNEYGIYMESQHGMCECYVPAEESELIDKKK